MQRVHMKHLDNIFTEELNKIAEEQGRELSETEITDMISEIMPEQSQIIRNELNKNTKEMLKERRKLSYEFTQRNIQRWKDAFDLLETHIVVCTEAGDDLNSSCRSTAVEEDDIVFDCLVRHHARACQISQEILFLLKNGYADAAHARWRALHEVTTTAYFISKHGKECAERFYWHDIIESYQGMLEHKKYEDRLNEKAHSQQQIDQTKQQYDELITKYGAKFSGHYGWAAYLFPNHRRVGFGAIEKDVGLEHWRPYYKWASQNIHAGSKGTRNRLGLTETEEDILLVGQSDAGMTDPAHSTVISLGQITTQLLMHEPSIDNIILINIINEYTKDVGEIFLATSQKAHNK